MGGNRDGSKGRCRGLRRASEKRGFGEVCVVVRELRKIDVNFGVGETRLCLARLSLRAAQLRLRLRRALRLMCGAFARESLRRFVSASDPALLSQ